MKIITTIRNKKRMSTKLIHHQESKIILTLIDIKLVKLMSLVVVRQVKIVELVKTRIIVKTKD